MKLSFFWNAWRGIMPPRDTRGWRPRRGDVRHCPLLQTLEDRNLLAVNVVMQFPGIGPDTAPVSPDTQVAAGPHFLVQVISNRVAFLTHQGTLVQDQSLDSFFASVDQSHTVKSEPAVIYDDMAQRFVIAVGDNGSLLVAVSDTSNPLDGFTVMGQFEFPYILFGPGSYTQPSAVGHVRIGWNADAYVFTLDHSFSGPVCYYYEGGFCPHTDTNGIVVVNKAAILDHDPPKIVEYGTSFGDQGYRIVAAAAMHDSAPGDGLWLVVGRYDHPNQVALVQMTNLLSGDPTFSKEISIPGFETGYPNEELAQLDWQQDHLVTALTVGSDGLYGVRWFDFDTSAGSLLQSGDIDPGPGASAFLPAMAIAANGDLGLTYRQLEPDGSLSMYVTGRKADDPPGTMQTPVLIQGGALAYAGDLGHYSGIAVDPVTGNSFWAVNAYSTLDYPSGWGTAIANFEITMDGGMGMEASLAHSLARVPMGTEPAQPVSLATLPTAASGTAGQPEKALAIAGTPVLPPTRPALLVLPGWWVDPLRQRGWLGDWSPLSPEEII